MQVSLGGGNFMIQGTSTKDAEFRLAGARNTPLCFFSLALGKNEDGSTKYASCKALGRTAKLAALIRKGTSVLAVGRIETNEKDGRTYKNFMAEWLMPADAGTLAGAERPQAADATEPDDGDDDLPF